MITRDVACLIVSTLFKGKLKADSTCCNLIQLLRAITVSNQHVCKLGVIIGIFLGDGLQGPLFAQNLIQSTAHLSQARLQFASTSVANYALFGGGGNAAGLVQYSTVDIFNAITGQWSVSALSQARSRLAATTVGPLALFGGGSINNSIDGSRDSDDVDIFNASTGLKPTAKLSVARADLSAASAGSFALFAGGTANSSINDTVDIFDSSAGLWSTAKLSQGRAKPASASVGNLAIFAGGTGGNTSFSNVVDIFDASTRSWSTSTLTVGRSELAATSVGKYALFAGGRANHTGISNVVDIFDATTRLWTSTTLSEKRTDLAVTSIGPYAIFGGGGFGGGLTGSAAVDIFDSRTGKWSTSRLSQGRYLLSATSVGNYALFGGGYGDASESSTVDVFLVVPEPSSVLLLVSSVLWLRRVRRF